MLSAVEVPPSVRVCATVAATPKAMAPVLVKDSGALTAELFSMRPPLLAAPPLKVKRRSVFAVVVPV